jgi:thiosulfate/3-mercaptopyruvate sulfurtransferase
MYRTLITVEDLAQRIADPTLVVVDCRFSLQDPQAGWRAYQRDHIPGAFYADLDRDLSGPIVAGKTGRHPLPDPEALAGRFRSWGMTSSSQLVCYDDAGGAMAARLWWLARWLGHDAVAVLDGGYPTWTAQGLGVVSDPAEPRSGSFSPSLRSDVLVDAERIDQMRKSAEDRVFDARELPRFRGDSEPIDPVAGHIPGARPLPLSENLEAGRFRSRDELSARYLAALAGVSPDRAAVYCGSGVTACHDILAAAHAGIQGIKLYPGSWSEWIVDASRPVARGD